MNLVAFHFWLSCKQIPLQSSVDGYHHGLRQPHACLPVVRLGPLGGSGCSTGALRLGAVAGATDTWAAWRGRCAIRAVIWACQRGPRALGGSWGPWPFVGWPAWFVAGRGRRGEQGGVLLGVRRTETKIHRRSNPPDHRNLFFGNPSMLLPLLKATLSFNPARTRCPSATPDHRNLSISFLEILTCCSHD